MERVIKFRGKCSIQHGWVYGYYHCYYNGSFHEQISSIDPEKGTTTEYPVDPKSVGQFTGLLDKNGKEIYEGDIIQYKRPYRTTQTHEGDNIPNGSYTEPMEPGIKIGGGEVAFIDGCFSVIHDDAHGMADSYQLSYAITVWDLPSIEEAISWHKPGAFIFDDPEEGDLQYLLEIAGVKEPKELIDLFNGVEIIGNIYENPELLNY